MIPTLTNKEFNQYRCAPDQVSILTGSMFWGALLGSFLVGSFIGLLVFLSLWQATVLYMAKLIALIIGVLAVAVIF
jgi:tetrahydromethanopterin S-methyltransferase subunit E